jgi:hypothetical protein
VLYVIERARCELRPRRFEVVPRSAKLWRCRRSTVFERCRFLRFRSGRIGVHMRLCLPAWRHRSARARGPASTVLLLRVSSGSFRAPATATQIDAPMSRQVFLSREFGFLFRLHGMVVKIGLLGCGQDRDGPRRQALMRSRPAGQERGPGAADGSLAGQHLGVRQPISGSGRPRGRVVSGVAGSGRFRGLRSV